MDETGLEIKPTEGYLPRFTRSLPSPERERILLRLDYPEKLRVDEWPVTFGVPFPRGALTSVEHLRIVDGAGEEIPAQIRQTASWHRPDGDVKWALVDMTVRRGGRYFAEFGRAVRRNAAPGSGAQAEPELVVEERDDAIVVTTGPLRARFSRSVSFPLAGVWLRRITEGETARGAGAAGEAWLTLLEDEASRPDEGPADPRRMFILDHLGRRAPTSDDPDDYQVEVEEAGPRRITVKATGWYRTEAGERFCRYVTRAHLCAGMTFVRFVHRFIVAFDTDRIRLRDIAIPFRLAGEPVAQALFQLGTGFDSARATARVPSHLVQETARSCVLREGDGAIVGTAARAGAWVEVANARGGLALGMRNFWQEYPRELEACPDGVVAHIWPYHLERPLDFSARAQLGPRYDAWGEQVYWENWYRGGLDRYDQAYGLAKTSELLLAFHAGDPAASEEARNAAAALEEPPFVVPEPEWMARSDAFGPLHPAGSGRFAEIEKAYECAWGHFEYLREHVWNHAEHIGNYGFFDYGDVNYHVRFDAASGRWEPQPWRRMASRFYGIHVLPWLQFARTGLRRYLRWAIDSARHVMDIDMCHLTNTSPEFTYPKYAGGRYGGNGGIIHYAGNIYRIGPDSHVTPWLYFYYLTGEREAWDTLLLEGSFYLDFPRESGLAALRTQYAHRASGGALAAMVDLWQATWDSRYLDAAREIAATLYSEAERAGDGMIRCDDVYMNRGMVAYYQATGDERMKELFLRNVRRVTEIRTPSGDPRAFTAYGPSMAYYFTGDGSYLERPLHQLQQFVNDVETEGPPERRGVPRGRWPMAHITVQLLYGPYLLEALTTLDEPPKPAPDHAGTTGEIWIHNREGRAFAATVFWSILSRPFHWGPVVREWPAYAHRRRPRARIVIVDPAGRVVADEAIDFAAAVRLPYNTQDYPFAGRARLDVPQGLPGTYRLAIEGAEAFPVKLGLISSDGLPWVFPLERGKISHGHRYYFAVPAGRERVGIAYKVFARLAEPADVRVILRDAAGRIVRKAEHPAEAVAAPREWHGWDVPVSSGERGTLWSVEVSPSVPEIQDVLLRLDGAPPVVSTAPDALFIPDGETAVRPPAKAAPPPGVGRVERVGPERPLVVPRGKPLGEGRYEHIDARGGTLEFWLSPEWDENDYADAELLRCGGLSLVRHSQVGLRLRLGAGIALSTGFLLRPGSWYHIAVTWNLASEAQPRAITLYIDGVPLAAAGDEPAPATSSSPESRDWTGDVLTVGGGAQMAIAALRLADRPRDQELRRDIFSPPAAGDALFAFALPPA